MKWLLGAPGPGRDYDRGDEIAAAAVPHGFEHHGTTDDGDDVLAPEDLRGRGPVVIYVEDDDARIWSYALVGGP